MANYTVTRAAVALESFAALATPTKDRADLTRSWYARRALVIGRTGMQSARLSSQAAATAIARRGKRSIGDSRPAAC